MNLLGKVMSFLIFFYTINHGEGLTYGSFKSDQERFNYGLEELGIVEEEKQRLLKKYNRFNGSENALEQNLYNKIKSISEADDLFEVLKEVK